MVNFWTNPIGWIVEFVTGFVSSAITTLQYWVLNSFIYTFEFLTGIIYRVGPLLSSAISQIHTWTIDLLDDTLTWVNDRWSNFSSFINEVRDNVLTWIDTAWSTLNDFWEDVTSHLVTWWNDTKKAVWDSIQSSIDTFSSWVVSGYTSITSWFSSTWSSLVTWVFDQWDNFTDWVNDVTTAVVDWWDDTKAAIWDSLTAAAETVVEWATDAFTGFIDWVDGLAGTVADFVNDSIAMAIETMQDTINGITDGIPDLVNGLFDALLTSNPVVKFLYDMITGSYSDTAEMKARQQDIINRRKELLEIINKTR